MKIELAKGPLGPDDLGAIARLYGHVDARYQAVGFCRRIFNDNPFGFSWHAFVRDGQRAVGHYAVIPIRARSAAITFTSGKGEALFLDEEYRSVMVNAGSDTLPAGIALMRVVHDLALSEGAVVLHNITSPEIGIIQRMSGFEMATIERDQMHFLFQLSGAKAQGGDWRGGALGLGVAGQRLASASARAVAAILRWPSVEIGQDLQPEVRSVVASSQVVPRGQWAVSHDAETLSWFGSLGRLRCVRCRDRHDDWMALSAHDRWEILSSSLPSGRRRAGGALMGAALSAARQSGALSFSIERYAEPRTARILGRAARWEGFLPKKVTVRVYTKASDAAPCSSSALAFGPLFRL